MEKPVFIRKDLDAKSELVYDADIRQSLFQEDRWYIIPKQFCYAVFGTVPCDSVVFHVCSKSWVCKTNAPDSGGIQTKNTERRTTLKEMQIPCIHCKEPVPESVVTVWTLHNWDSLVENEHTA
jgi:hypothetical protein